MSTIKGLWTFKRHITLPASTISQSIIFGNNTYQGFVIYQYGIDYILANGARETLVYSENTKQWKSEEIRSVDFGEEEVEVSEIFLNWFLANAVKNKAGEIALGTYRFKDSFSLFPQETTLAFDYKILNFSYNGVIYNFIGRQIKLYNDGVNNFIKYYGTLNCNEGSAEIEFIAYSDREDLNGWGTPYFPDGVESPGIMNGASIPPNFGQTIFIVNNIEVSSDLSDWFNISANRRIVKILAGAYKWKEQLSTYLGKSLDLDFSLSKYVTDDVEYEISIHNITIEDDDNAGGWTMWYNATLSTSQGISREVSFPVYNSEDSLWGYGSTWNADIPWGFGQTIIFDKDTEIDASFFDWFTQSTNSTTISIIRKGTYKFNSTLSLGSLEENYIVSLPFTTSLYVIGTEEGAYIRNIPQKYKAIRFNSTDYSGNSLIITDLDKNEHICYTSVGSRYWNACYDYYKALDPNTSTELQSFGQIITVTRNTPVSEAFATWFSSNTTALIKAKTYQFNDVIYSNKSISASIQFVSNGKSFTKIQTQSSNILKFVNSSGSTTIVYTNNNWASNFYRTIKVTQNTYVSVEFYNWAQENWGRIAEAPSVLGIVGKLQDLVDKINLVTQKEDKDLFTATDSLIENVLYVPNGTINITENTPGTTINVAKYAQASVNVPQPVLKDWGTTVTTNGWLYPSQINADGIKSVEIRVPTKVVEKRPKTITANGTFYASDDYVNGVRLDGYSEVKVALPINDWPYEITTNSDYEASDMGWAGVRSFKVRVPQAKVGPRKEKITENNKRYSVLTDDSLANPDGVQGYTEFEVAVPEPVIIPWPEKITSNTTINAEGKDWDGISYIEIDIPETKIGKRAVPITKNGPCTVAIDPENTEGVEAYTEFEVAVPEPVIIPWPEKITANTTLNAEGEDWDGISYIEIDIPETKIGKRKTKIINNGPCIVATDPGNTEGVEAYTEFEVAVPQKTIQEEAYVIKQNGDFFAYKSGVDGYAHVKVEVPEGSGGGTGGSGDVVIPEGYLKPTGTKDIFTNGRINIAAYEWVNVMVTGGDGTGDVPEYDGRYRITGEITEETCDCEVFEEYDGRYRVTGEITDEEGTCDCEEISEYDGRHRVTGEVTDEESGCVCETIEEYDGRYRIEGEASEETCDCEILEEYDGACTVLGDPTEEEGSEFEFYDGLITVINLGGN